MLKKVGGGLFLYLKVLLLPLFFYLMQTLHINFNFLHSTVVNHCYAFYVVQMNTIILRIYR